MNIEKIVVKKEEFTEEITKEDPLSYKPAIEEIDDKTITVKHELEHNSMMEEDSLLITPEIQKIEGQNITVKYEIEDEVVESKVDPLSVLMDQDPLADAVKQEDYLDIKIEELV